MLSSLLSLIAAGQAPSGLEFELRSGKGLEIKASGVPVVLGSGFQYFEPGWTKGYFSTAGSSQDIRRVDADNVEMRFSGADGQASGREVLYRDGNRLNAHYHLEWSGDHPVGVELNAGLLWAPAVEHGRLRVEGVTARSLEATTYAPDQDVEQRRYSPDAKLFEFKAPVADVSIKSGLPLTLFDARGFHQDYAEGRTVLWCGALDLPIERGKPIDLDIVWTVVSRPFPADGKESEPFTTAPIADAQGPSSSPAPLIPKPKRADLDYEHPIAITNSFAFPAGYPHFWGLFKEALSRRYVVPPPVKGAAVIDVDAGVSRLGLHPGGYTIDIRDNRVSVLGEDEEGLRSGTYRLAQLAFVRNNRLFWPHAHMEDEPQVPWRGVHLFAGPEAREFQSRLWDRVLLPLGLNKAVIECERTAWASTPLSPEVHPMSKEDLAGLFADYRKRGVEPIPLIQSLGHMGWFFHGGRRTELAVNPKQPYTLDSRKPAVKTATENLWDEVFELLKPSTVHFGCDEIDLVGMQPHDPKLITELWRDQMATLGDIAKRHDARMMIWGDEALASGEAIDATNGDGPEEAFARRAAIPTNAVVCDWHYAPIADPAKFYPTLQLWQREGHFPIASTWFRPDNIRGFDVAAGIEHVGALQTTWAGYESSEAAMLANSEQFTAMVLAADYSWSRREDAVGQLGYDPVQVFRDMYFEGPSPVLPSPGFALRWTAKDGTAAGAAVHRQVGFAGFSFSTPFAFRSRLRSETQDAPTEFELSGRTPRAVSHLALAIGADVEALDGDLVAEVDLTLANGQAVHRKLVYGHQIRAGVDRRLLPFASRSSDACAYQIDFAKPSIVNRLTVRVINETVGFKLFAATAW